MYEGGVQDLIDQKTTPRYLVRLRSDPATAADALERCEWVTDLTRLGAGQLSIGVTATASR